MGDKDSTPRFIPGFNTATYQPPGPRGNQNTQHAHNASGSAQPPGQSAQHARNASGSAQQGTPKARNATLSPGASDFTSASGTSSTSMSDNSEIAEFINEYPPQANNSASNVQSAEQIDADNKATILYFLSYALVIRRHLYDQSIVRAIGIHVNNWPDTQVSDALAVAKQRVDKMMSSISGMSERKELQQESLRALGILVKWFDEHGGLVYYGVNGEALRVLVEEMEDFDGEV